MAAADNIKTAAGQLRGAAADLQSKARTVQSDHDRNKSQLLSDISKTENELTAQTAMLGATNDDQQKAAAQQTIKQYQQQLDQQKQALNVLEKQTGPLLQAHNDVASQLEGLAKQLDSLAGSLPVS